MTATPFRLPDKTLAENEAPNEVLKSENSPASILNSSILLRDRASSAPSIPNGPNASKAYFTISDNSFFINAPFPYAILK
jgi:hypothetical protein